MYGIGIDIPSDFFAFLWSGKIIAVRFCTFLWSNFYILPVASYLSGGMACLSFICCFTAVGVLMWEIFMCGEMPYSNQKNNIVVEDICQKRRHLSKPDNCPESVFSIVLECWQYVSI